MAIHIEFEDGTVAIAIDGKLSPDSLEYTDAVGDLVTVPLQEVRAIRQADEDRDEDGDEE